MSLRYGLRDGDVQKLQAVLTRYPQITEAIIYGSRAKGNYKPGSDIDLTLKAKMDSWTFNQLLVELDDLLLPYQIDLSLYNEIQNSELKSHIDRVGQVFFERS